MRIAARDRHQQRDGGAERRDLREREVDEDDPALDDVHAQVGVDARQDQAGDERRRQELEDGDRESCLLPLRRLDGADVGSIDVVVEQLDVVGRLLRRPDRRRQDQTFAAGLRAMEFGVFRSKYGSTRISLTCWALHRLITSRVCCGVGGMPGLGST